MANIYRSPCPDIITFIDELSDLEDFMVTTGDHPIFVGDFNCVGATPEDISTRLKT